ncbi:hypothetical protein BGZ99_008405 [Dissophora globulifera]|uniref:Major facilitator superfamily (MFS) profile domain-containing protein n=1 Tax=Dissophora globulifera TaxID=979702 RepID=A0A9P6RVB1_9FUNG|nr:hypothetical protein BGZ99_008405 [Dissophora globulifera]
MKAHGLAEWSDIKAVISIGDSITAGFAMLSGRPPFATILEFRGKVFSGGGDDGEYTLTNFLRTYTKNIKGSPSGFTLPLATGKGLNTAVSGAIAQTLPSQVERLRRQFGRAGIYHKYKNEWKLATIFIGANNLCAACGPESIVSEIADPEEYGAALKLALQELRDSIGPTFVNLVGIFDVTLVYELSRGYPYCELLFDKLPFPICGCATGDDADRKKAGDLSKKYNEVMERVAHEINEESSDSRTFGVTFQPGLTEFKDGSSPYGQGYLSGLDCFHPNKCANQVMAVAIWNNMFSDREDKYKPMKPSDLEIYYHRYTTSVALKNMSAAQEKPMLTRVDSSLTISDSPVATTSALDALTSLPVTIIPGPTAATVLEQSLIKAEAAAAAAAAASDPPDGGSRAWLVVLGSFLVHSIAFVPTEFIFGIFELHYQIIYPDAAASSIAFVGTIGSAVTYLSGFLAGIIADRFGFRITVIAGTTVMTLSLVLASFAKQLWQLYLTQGVLFGIGSSLAYYPAVAVPSHYFTKKRGLATGVAVSGVGVGGLILAPVTNALIERTGIYWTLRILALITLVVCGTASIFIVESKNHLKSHATVYEESSAPEQEEDLEKKTEKSKGEKSFFSAVKVFKDPQFLSLAMAELAVSIGLLMPLYYIPTYAVFIGVSAEKGALILGLSNGASFVGRIVLGVISDYISNEKVLLLCAWCTSLAVLVVWTVSRSFGALLIMGLMFGFFAGGYISLVPVAVADCFGTKEMASTIGMMYAAGGLGVLGGAPLAGYLLDITRPNISYLPVTMTAGGTMTLGALGITAWVYLSWKAKSMQRFKTSETLA